jgi:hypothetical protein
MSWRYKRKMEDIIKVNLKDSECEEEEWIYLAQDIQ